MTDDAAPLEATPMEAEAGEKDEEPAKGRRPRAPKKPPVPALEAGSWVKVGDGCRSAALREQVGTVVTWGRQVEVALRGKDGSEGEVRKFNPPDLVAIDEPEFAPAEQSTGEEAAPAPAPAPAAAATAAAARPVRSMPLGEAKKTKSEGEEVRSSKPPAPRARGERAEPACGSSTNSSSSPQSARQPRPAPRHETNSTPLVASRSPRSAEVAPDASATADGPPASPPLDQADAAPNSRRRGQRPKKEGAPKDALTIGGWVRISDTCRSVAMRGQLGIVKEVGRQVDVAMGGDDATVRKLNPNDLVFVGMVRARPLACALGMSALCPRSHAPRCQRPAADPASPRRVQEAPEQSTS